MEEKTKGYVNVEEERENAHYETVKKESYANFEEIPSNERNFKEEWKNLVSESLDLGLTLEESLKEQEPSTQQEFKELVKILEEKYFSSALTFEKEILPPSVQPETFLKKIKDKGRSSKDIFLLSKSKYSFMKLGFKFETYLGAGKKETRKIK